MPSLPSVTSDIPRDLRQFLDRVRENVDGRGLDEVVTARKLVAAGLAEYTGGKLASATADTVYGTPPAPVNLDADGALASIVVTWDKAVYPGHAYTEIWSAQQTPAQASASPEEYPDLGEAELVGMAPGSVWVDNIGAGGSRWYWVRFINVEGQAGAYNAVDGLRGDTGTDSQYVVSLLSGEISASELATSLTDRIDLIDGAETLSNSVAARIATVQGQVNSLLNLPAWNSSTTYATGDQVVHNGFSYSALSGNTNVTPGTNASVWDEIGEFSTLGDAVATHTSQISVLESSVGLRATEITTLASQLRGDYTGSDLEVVSQGLLYDEREARSTQDTALASSISTVSAFVNTKTRTFYQSTEPEGTADQPLNEGDMWIDTDITYADDYVEGDYVIQSNRMYRYDGTNWVEAMDFGFADWFTAIRTEKTARVDEDEALAESITTLTANTSNSLSLINNTLSTHTDEISSNALSITTLTATVGGNKSAIEGSLEIERLARVAEDSALAGQITTAQTNLGNDITAAVAVETSARGNAVGAIEAKNTVKIDVAGHVSGYGLISTSNGATPTSEFGIRADSFWIAPAAVSQNDAPTENLFPGYVWVDTSGTDPETKYYNGTNFTTTPQNLPFIVRTSPTTINGETVPVGVYMQDAYIANGTITNAKIGDAAIDNAKIDSLDASKITAGFIDTARIEADSITATMIDSRGLSIKDADGNVVFSAGTPLDHTNVDGLGDLAEFNDITLSYVTDAGDLAALDEVAESDLATGLAGLIDGKMESWFQDADPSTDWTDDATRTKHLGDMWWKTDDNKLYRYKYSDSTYSWETITDKTATDAYANAATAQDTADGKRRVFTSEPVPPYDVGDLWDRGATTGLYRCSTAKAEDADFAGGDWQVVADTTSENTAASIADQGDFATLDQVTAGNISTYIAAGAIGNAYIGNVIQSANYNETNQTGWKIDKTGAMVMNNATFRGDLDMVGTTGTNRLNITSSKIEVIDSSNVVRVRIGDLS